MLNMNFHLKQIFRLKTNEDMFHHLLLLSDPGITIRYGSSKKKKHEYCDEVKELIYIDE